MVQGWQRGHLEAHLMMGEDDDPVIGLFRLALVMLIGLIVLAGIRAVLDLVVLMEAVGWPRRC
mgnify:CR=1 FL=1